jgi:phosphoenolpyruvate carboxylase
MSGTTEEVEKITSATPEQWADVDKLRELYLGDKLTTEYTDEEVREAVHDVLQDIPSLAGKNIQIIRVNSISEAYQIETLLSRLRVLTGGSDEASDETDETAE